MAEITYAFGANNMTAPFGSDKMVELVNVESRAAVIDKSADTIFFCFALFMMMMVMMAMSFMLMLMFFMLMLMSFMPMFMFFMLMLIFLMVVVPMSFFLLLFGNLAFYSADPAG